MKADLWSAVARQASVLRGDCWQRETDCERRSAGCDEPRPEIWVAGAGRTGATAAAIEIPHPANWSARPSRDAARPNPLLCLPARLRLSRCLIRLGEHPPPRSFIHRVSSLLGQGETRHCQPVACRQHRLGSLCHVHHSSMLRGVCQVILKKLFLAWAAVLESVRRAALK